MKHVILMTVYRDAELVNRILMNVPNDWDVYIHIDKKVSSPHQL